LSLVDVKGNLPANWQGIPLILIPDEEQARLVPDIQLSVCFGKTEDHPNNFDFKAIQNIAYSYIDHDGIMKVFSSIVCRRFFFTKPTNIQNLFL
jgi:hypothetical protein